MGDSVDSCGCVAAAARLRGYVGGGVDGITRGASSFGGGEDGGGGEEDHEDGRGCGSDVPGIFWGGVGIGCGVAVVISGVDDSISG